MRKPLLDKVGVMYCMIETLLLVCYVGLCVIEPSFFADGNVAGIYSTRPTTFWGEFLRIALIPIVCGPSIGFSVCYLRTYDTKQAIGRISLIVLLMHAACAIILLALLT